MIALPLLLPSGHRTCVTGPGVLRQRALGDAALLHSGVGGRQSRRSLPPWRRRPAYERFGD